MDVYENYKAMAEELFRLKNRLTEVEVNKRQLVLSVEELLTAWEAWDDGLESVLVYEALAKLRTVLAVCSKTA